MVLLVADDENFIRRGLMSLKWQNLGIDQVYEASNGIEVKNLLAQGNIDILISDIRMPGMDGLELADDICRRGLHTKVILLTGFSDFEYAKQAIRSQVSDYLLKPVNTDELYASVRAAMEKLRKERYEASIISEYEASDRSVTVTDQVLRCFRHMDFQAAEMLEYMAENYGEDISLQLLSEKYHLSTVYISRYIKKETGYSFVDILTCIRLMAAVSMLAEGSERVSMVCDKCGFKDQRYFSQIFKRTVGCKPIEYKKNKSLQKNFTVLELLELKTDGNMSDGNI